MGHSVAHPSGDPSMRYTMSRHRVSHHIPAESEMLRPNCATPPKSRCCTFLRTPPVALSSRSQQAGGQGGVSRRAGGGYRGTFGFRKRIALQEGVAATVTPVALLCATKLMGHSLKTLTSLNKEPDSLISLFLKRQ